MATDKQMQDITSNNLVLVVWQKSCILLRLLGVSLPNLYKKTLEIRNEFRYSSRQFAILPHLRIIRYKVFEVAKLSVIFLKNKSLCLLQDDTATKTLA